MKLHEVAAGPTQHAPIKQILDNLKIKNYTIQPDGTVRSATNPEGMVVDVNGNVDLRNFNVTIIPVKFGKVSGSFFCSRTKITSLDGAPTSVGGSFDCSHTKITSLAGAPTSVGGDFYCSGTEITSLDGAPTAIGGGFTCSHTNITSLDGAPTSVGGGFFCSYTKITSLIGAPTAVGGSFNCSGTNITSLDGAPKAIGGNFYCSHTKIRNVLRFLQIRGVNHIVYDSGPIDEILNKYAGTGDVISAQDELIDAGFIEQAKL